MFASLRARQPGASLRRVLFWLFIQTMSYIWLVLFYRYRAFGVRNTPRHGAVIFISNHQSFLDPLAIGIASHHRQLYAMARESLFKNPMFAWLIRGLNAFPVRQGIADMAAIRKANDALKRQQALIVFAEGTRTPDGTTKPFSSGTMILIKRNKPQVVPVAIQGAYDVWPRHQKLPKLTGHIRVMFGAPIPAQRLIDMGTQDALDHLHTTVESMRLRLSNQPA